MTQSAASQAMAGMEATLGAQLFTREPRKTLPTALGLSVIEQARVMLGALQAIRSTVDEARPMLRGTIRIASFPMVLATFLTPFLQRFRQLYPGIDVTTLDVTDNEVLTLLEADLIDLGDTRVDFTGLLATLGDIGARTVLCEGGPRLNHQLLAAGLVDELCLTISPRIVGGAGTTGPGLLNGEAFAVPSGLRLDRVLAHDDFLFCRYLVV
jgi:DNA-binding transcriptional LysR family regulator